MIAIVVPKGSTIDQICGPRSSYDVIRRIVINNKLRLRSGTPKGNLYQVENRALVPKAATSQSERSRPLSYASVRVVHSICKDIPCLERALLSRDRDRQSVEAARWVKRSTTVHEVSVHLGAHTARSVKVNHHQM